jgi:hypothetical protein
MVIVDSSTVRVSGSYIEPSTDSDGGALVDLAYTNVYYKIGTGLAVRGPQVPASNVSGGGTINTSLLVPVSSGQRVNVGFWVTATDIAGLESAATPTITLLIDRVAPAAPRNFTIA